MVSTDENLTLLTDLYQLTMAQGYWASGIELQKILKNLHVRLLKRR